MDECSQQGICNNGQCNNTPGSFICSCPPGYDLASDGKRCIGNLCRYTSGLPRFSYTVRGYDFPLDHNECEKNGMCANGKCLNVQGSFQCRCKSGFVMSQTGHSCIGKVSCCIIIITIIWTESILVSIYLFNTRQTENHQNVCKLVMRNNDSI